jgi:membrane protease YdiL (CAAX protease family)
VELRASARQFPVAAAILTLSATLFGAGVSALLVLRAQPPEARSALLQALPMPAVIAGGVIACAGLAVVLLGWGDGAPGAPLPAGSHRSILVTTGLAIIAALTVSVLSIAAFPAVAPESTGLFLFVAGVMDVSLLTMFYFQGVRRGIITAATLGLSPGNVEKAIKWGLGGAGALLLLSVSASAVMTLFGVRQPQGEWLAWLRDLPRPQLLLILVAGVVAAPVAEELFFRGYVFNAYLAEKGTLTAYVASALIFGLVHGHVALLLAIFPMGLVLAYLYRRSGTILAPMLAHVLNNGFAFAALLGARP